MGTWKGQRGGHMKQWPHGRAFLRGTFYRLRRELPHCCWKRTKAIGEGNKTMHSRAQKDLRHQS